ncbi:heme/hemin ABC transporter substrate-binding protein [Hoeflea prorocentri]|uniref:ABC transporter substrate-binding protein n=1 Tax=Hoeflea prorocentri TaxID=1922333 RepID=A0A9X3ZFH3_9HYPH|nr:ABC transporter substrate-binding protein [Hoeflea prorocentri]MCY6379677.1 ABC transporter substrate-binding protein [Hoeflea prorocentri]MDA5397477.1 ABC transporter substrate-binding protein [Hoeflea prorocentri]
MFLQKIKSLSDVVILFLLLAVSAAHANKDAGSIVSIGGSITEIVFALGEQDRLVARDTTSNYPEDATKLPDVGYIRALSPEGVLSVGPDMILALEGSGPPEALEALKGASVPIVTIPERFDRDGIVAKIIAVGNALGVANKAEALAKQVEADVSRAQRQAAQVSQQRRVLFVLSLQGGRVLAAGANTSAAAIIEMAGGENALSDFSGYKQVNDEAIITAAPDIILVMSRTGNHQMNRESVLGHPALNATPAGKNAAIVEMGGQYLLGFGPRTAEAVRELSASLNGNDN